MAAEGTDQAHQIRVLRSTIQYSMTPVPRLSDVPPDQAPRLEFMDHPCTEDCSGHVAGWEWAAKRSATRVAECYSSNSESFSEGCRIYLWRMGYGPEPD